MSGAANYAASVLKEKSAVFREVFQDEGRSPWLPNISPGACAALEQFLCAYVATGVHNAMQIRKQLNSSKQLSERLVNMGFDAANETVFGPARLAPRTITMATTLKVVKGKKEEDKVRTEAGE